MNIWNEIIIGALFLLGSFYVFSLVTRAIRKRYGDYVADDKLTRAGVFAGSALLFVALVEGLTFITGHLSGRL